MQWVPTRHTRTFLSKSAGCTATRRTSGQLAATHRAFIVTGRIRMSSRRSATLSGVPGRQVAMPRPPHFRPTESVCISMLATVIRVYGGMTTYAERYMIRGAALAAAGRKFEERPCVPTETVTCQFPAYWGTVTWKTGFQSIKDAFVDNDGNQVDDVFITACKVPGANCRRRFDQRPERYLPLRCIRPRVGYSRVPYPIQP